MASMNEKVIAQRVLTVREGEADRPVSVTIYQPRAVEENWSCRYAIDWPGGARSYESFGIDSVQALYLALTMIGAELYSAQKSRESGLKWLAPGKGFGFPLASSIRDIAVGEDRYL